MPLRKPLVLVGGRPSELPSTDTVTGSLSLVGIATVGETTLVALGLGVKRYAIAIAGLAVTDRIIATLSGIPANGSLQDVYVSAANTLSVGVLAPALGVGAIISVPVAFYRVN